MLCLLLPENREVQKMLQYKFQMNISIWFCLNYLQRIIIERQLLPDYIQGLDSSTPSYICSFLQNIHVGTIDSIKCQRYFFQKTNLQLYVPQLYIISFLSNCLHIVNSVFKYLNTSHCFQLLEEYRLVEDVLFNICIILSKTVLQKYYYNK